MSLYSAANNRKEPFLHFTSTADAKYQGDISLRLLCLTFLTDRNWNHYIESIAKSSARKVGSLSRVRPFYLQNPCCAFIRLDIKYCFHIWSISPAIYLKILDIIQSFCSVISPSMVTRLYSLSHHHDVVSLCHFHKHFHEIYSDVSLFVPRLH